MSHRWSKDLHTLPKIQINKAHLEAMARKDDDEILQKATYADEIQVSDMSCLEKRI